MRALVKAHAEPGLWLQDVPEPEIGINDVLIRVDRTGICGTDLHISNWDAWAQKTIPVGLVIGHEFVGDVVAVGENVTGFAPGDLVSGEGHLVCGRCRNCMAGRRHLCAHTEGIGVSRTGAFAEYIALPMTNVWHHGKNIDRDVASIFDPFGNAVHTALAFPVLGEDVLITGAGPIGHDGRGGRPPRRRAPRRDHRRQPRPAGARAEDGRHPRRRREQRGPRRRAAGAAHGGGLRRRPGDVRQRQRAARHDRQHVPRREDRHARHPARASSRSTGTRSCSTCSRSRASTGARCTRPGTR